MVTKGVRPTDVLIAQQWSLCDWIRISFNSLCVSIWFPHYYNPSSPTITSKQFSSRLIIITWLHLFKSSSREMSFDSFILCVAPLSDCLFSCHEGYIMTGSVFGLGPAHTHTSVQSSKVPCPYRSVRPSVGRSRPPPHYVYSIER